MFWVELIIVLAMIFLGTRKGGPFLALAGGLGMLIMTFVLRVPPSDPPITVIRIMIAVIVAASCMQAAGGADSPQASGAYHHPGTCGGLHIYLYVRHRPHRL